ncbi:MULTISPECIES: basic amino acid ABC transporter substrate-binding protein [Anaerostipes]|uniref:Basic amino acid ABC transporter substrate-binding protein n=1 Tax=Anaerostipes butyraticus TaxID=645466 RepID=A0A916VCT8_9FIRM|nr:MULTISPECIES: basic amino acid ABC transporter substrate-binding protein [Anaerostipes]GFO84413.1 basic amino acid ABC transporter substrate-binding protein [Anaerostipes butyraticus]HJC82170.1 basic amino acid ABC transporter substrate-binding protein [Candidatus Anaerostipes avicola]
MKKFLTVALAGVLAASMLFTGCGKKETADGGEIPDTIVVGTNAEFPPFEYVNDDGDVDGFDMAVMKEVGKKIGSDVEIKNMEFKSLIGSMESGNLDVIAAGMTVTKERERQVDFTDSYYTAKQYVIQKEGGSIKSADDLEGLTIAVQEGTTGDLLATDEIKDSNVKRFKKGVDAVMDLKKGGSDVVIIDANPAQEFVKANKGLELVKDLFDDESYAFAVQKGNTKLKDAINDALKEMKDDGTFDKLVKEYIGQ